MLAITMVFSISFDTQAQSLYACIEKGAVGFKRANPMEPTIFNSGDHFILKFDKSGPKLSAQDIGLFEEVPQLCTKMNPYHLQVGITCMTVDGNQMMSFNPDTKNYRYVFLGLIGDDSFISQGTCQKF